jgi:hypothetical protein
MFLLPTPLGPWMMTRLPTCCASGWSQGSWSAMVQCQCCVSKIGSSFPDSSCVEPCSSSVRTMGQSQRKWTISSSLTSSCGDLLVNSLLLQCVVVVPLAKLGASRPRSYDGRSVWVLAWCSHSSGVWEHRTPSAQGHAVSRIPGIRESLRLAPSNSGCLDDLFAGENELLYSGLAPWRR